MSRLTEWMDRTFYPDFSNNWDDDIFRSILEKRINSAADCLDYGAGRGNVRQMNFRGIAKFVAGIDPDDAVLQNPHLDEAKLLDLTTNTIPYEDNRFDVVFSDNVLEHVANPEAVFREISRVLKPGGVFLAKTPNKWHYIPLIATLTPTSFHRFYNKLRGREQHDTFPTVYKANSRSAVAGLATEAGLEVQDMRFIEARPEYLRLSALTYVFGLAYERIVNLTEGLARFRCVMIAELRKAPR